MAITISDRLKQALIDFLIGFLFLLFTFTLMSYLNINLALIGEVVIGFMIGYIRKGEKGVSVKKAASMSIFHLFMAFVLIQSWNHALLFLLGFISVYLGIIVEQSNWTKQLKAGITAGYFILIALFALFIFPKMITWALSDNVALSIQSTDLLTTDSVTINTEQFKGEITVVDFWATWCKPCIEEMHVLQANKEGLDTDGVNYYFVNRESKSQTWENFTHFTDSASFDFDFLYDPDGVFATQTDVSAFPTVFIIDEEGVIRRKHQGFYRGEDIVTYINNEVAAVKEMKE